MPSIATPPNGLGGPGTQTRASQSQHDAPDLSCVFAAARRGDGATYVVRKVTGGLRAQVWPEAGKRGIGERANARGGTGRPICRSRVPSRVLGGPPKTKEGPPGVQIANIVDVMRPAHLQQMVRTWWLPLGIMTWKVHLSRVQGVASVVHCSSPLVFALVQSFRAQAKSPLRFWLEHLGAR